MDAKKIIKWGRILAIICLLAYATVGSIYNLTVEHPLMKGLLLAGGLLLIAISVYGLYIKYKKQ